MRKILRLILYVLFAIATVLVCLTGFNWFYAVGAITTAVVAVFHIKEAVKNGK